jgi:hypothetical protein
MRIVVLAIAIAGCRGLLGFEEPVVLDQPVDASFVDEALDGPRDALDVGCSPQLCLAIGGACDNDVCVIDPGNNVAKVTCPGGQRCRVRCIGVNACPMLTGIECSMGARCDVLCTGQNACQNASVTCGPASECAVLCEDDNACSLGVSCNMDATCDVTCNGSNTCGTVTGTGAASCTAHCCNGGCNLTADCLTDAVCP